MALELPKAALSVLPSPDLLLFFGQSGCSECPGVGSTGGKALQSFPSAGRRISPIDSACMRRQGHTACGDFGCKLGLHSPL